ncbi:MAG: ATP-binding protein [Chromatiales bacterium]|jgi:nitrogen fixation/metabolism regulation signal transduction histidine kinase
MRKFTRSSLLMLLLLLLPLLVSLHLMSSAVQNSDDLSRMFIPLLVFNLLGLFIILVLIVVNLVRLVSQYRRREPGSRLTLRMVLVFLTLSLPPVSIVYYYSLQFLHRGIDSWFDVQIDSALDDSLELGRASLDLNKRQFLRATEQLLGEVEDTSEAAMAVSLVDLLNRSGATELALLDFSGRVIASSNINPEQLVPEKPDMSVIQQVRDGGSIVSVIPFGENEILHIRAVVKDFYRPLMLQAIYPMTEHISDLTGSVQAALVRYKELAFLRQSLKFNFSLTLLLVLAFAIFSAVWAAFYSARRLVAPISDIAAGTRAVAAGDYEKQLPLQHTHDELGFLVASFNTMMRRISQASDQAARSQRLVEEQKTYLETVLGHLSSGVMVFDNNKRLQTANRAAQIILKIELDNFIQHQVYELRQVSEQLSQWVDSIDEALGEADSEWREQTTLYGPEGRLVLLTRISPLLDSKGRSKGRVVVFDDITQLIQAQRNAAWGEVARRLAHEIKNPLTPIQLAAERLRHKYLNNMPPEDAQVLDKATHTIVQQVDAMKSMVNAFSDYAKPSQLETRPVAFDELVAEVLALYEHAALGNHIEVHLDAGPAMLEADPVRLRQVIHNLVKNSLEAVAEVEQPWLSVTTSLQVRADGVSLELEVQDNGGGFDEESLGSVFEPYVTTKAKGTGLGLAIVKKIIEEHGGMIAASNRPQGGARIVVRLPVIADQQMDSAAQDAGAEHGDRE